MKSCLVAALLGAVASSAQANFTVFNGGLAAETSWQASVGATVLENFESFTEGTQIQSLPALHLTFDELAGGGYSQTYRFNSTPHGPMQLGNFPNGINAINQWNDIFARPTAGFTLHSMGFWNGDGQSATLFAVAYDSSGNLLGSAGALNGTFAGFVSDTPVAWVKFEGDTGDGWNHLDGLQVNAVAAIPEPETYAMLLAGLGLLGFAARRRKRKAVQA